MSLENSTDINSTEHAQTDQDNSTGMKGSELAQTVHDYADGVQIATGDETKHEKDTKDEQKDLDSEQNQASNVFQPEKTLTAKRLPRSQRKKLRREERLKRKKEMRSEKRQEKKQRLKLAAQEIGDAEHAPKRKSRRMIRRKDEAGLKIGQKICIDCSFEDIMSVKEHSKLARHFGYLHGTNRKYENPAHIYMTGLKTGGQLYNAMIKQNCGFLDYSIDIEEKQHTELFPLDKITVLSPDSKNVLEEIDPERIYVIGGLADETVKKYTSLNRANEAKLHTARLPIDKYMVKIDQPSHSKVLSINVVFDILMTYIATKSWTYALSEHFPKRKGYIIKEFT